MIIHTEDTCDPALSKIEYKCGEGQNPFLYIDSSQRFVTQFPQGKVFVARRMDGSILQPIDQGESVIHLASQCL
jgi:hypothetical protein